MVTSSSLEQGGVLSPALPRRTDHGRLRQRQRNISDSELAYVLRHGARLHRTGVVFVILRRRDIPNSDRGRDEWAKLEGTTVLLTKGGSVITVYRDKGAPRKVARKAKRRHPYR